MVTASHIYLVAMLVSGLSASLPAATGGGQAAPARPHPQLVLSSSPTTFSVETVVELEVKLVNRGPGRFRVPSRLFWGQVGGFRSALFQDGRPVNPLFLDDEMFPPGSEDASCNCVTLDQDSLIGVRRRLRGKDLFEKPGRYEVRAEYLSPVSNRERRGRGCLAREDGRLASEAITVELTK